MNDIRSLYLSELTEYIKKNGFPAYRAGQIFSWLHEKGVRSFDEMTNVPGDIKSALAKEFVIRNIEPEKVRTSKLDGTKKYLFRLNDGNSVESVMMRYKHGISVCVSSQAGCAMGCRFCASTVGGLIRNLTAGEMLAQVYEIGRENRERVSNVVVMGMGEPLANYDSVVRFARLLSDEKALHISQRNITISTCGIVPAIYKLADENLKVTLALSLHAPNDEIRRQLMPVADRYPMDEVLEACRDYFDVTGRRITFEYCLVGGVNDSPASARELASKLKGMNAHVNLIPVNPNPENSFREPDDHTVSRFISILEKHGITATKRREMGRDISGACGQLRRQSLEEGGGYAAGIRPD